MDGFVEMQLKHCNCEKYIQLFKEKGYNEDKYRNLRMTTLVQLIPNDDELSIEMIWDNVVNLRSSDDNGFSSTVSDAAAAAVIKVEPPSSSSIFDSLDDEVEVIQVVKRAPMNLIFWPSSTASIKLEPADDPNVPHPMNTVNTSSIPGGPSQDNNNMEIRIKISDGIGNNQLSLNNEPLLDSNEVRMKEDAVDMDNNGFDVNPSNTSKRRIEETEVSEKSGSRSTEEQQKRQRGISTMQSVPGGGPSNNISKVTLDYIEHHSGEYQNYSQLNLSQVIHIGQKHRELKIYFEFDSLNELNTFLQELRICCSEFKNVEKLKIVALNKDVYVGQSQLEQISSIEPTFLEELKSLVFEFGFYDDIEPRLITQLLSCCTNLQTFKVRREIFGNTQAPIKLNSIIQIPQMSKLTTFRWGKMFAVSFFQFPKRPIEINLEEESQVIIYHPMNFEINFSNHQFMDLNEISVGCHSTVKFQDLTQFPSLTKFDMTSHEVHGISNSVNSLTLPHGMSDDIIVNIPTWFPTLTCLRLRVSSVACLRTLIHVMSKRELETLIINVDYDFDDALTSGLLDLPYRLSSIQDNKKLESLKKYKYWKQLSKHIGIELPVEEDDNELDDPAGQACQSIGSFKTLKKLVIKFWPKLIRLPKDDLHWRDPKVEYCDEYWSSKTKVFPMMALINEFVQLKPTLEELTLSDYQILPEDSIKFEQLMGFKPSLYKENVPEGLDTFSAQKKLQGAIKQEK